MRPQLPETLAPLQNPEFGTYHPEDVTWLIRDMTTELASANWEGVGTLGPTSTTVMLREEPPAEDRLEFFRRYSRLQARRTAETVGIVAELAYAERGPHLVLASIIRAGVPIGVLLRRWLQWRRATDVPHYAMSVVPGDGVDPAALKWLSAHHDPAAVQFVDGWTGRGSITLEVAASLKEIDETQSFNPGVAVLVDFGECASLFGTREDFLVPLACVDVVSVGCISRTILRPEWTENGRYFHGAADKRDQFQSTDHSRWYIDQVVKEFAHVLKDVEQKVADRQQKPKPPVTFSGRPAARQVGARYSVDDLTFVRPGIGETTRLLIRDPDPLLLVRDPWSPDLQPVMELADARELNPIVDPALEFACVGLAESGRR